MTTAPQPPGLSARLRSAREGAGLSLRQAAHVLGCTHVWLGGLERGSSTLSVAWADRLADTYGVSLDWLIRGTEAPVPAGVERDLARLPSEAAATVRELIRRLGAS